MRVRLNVAMWAATGGLMLVMAVSFGQQGSGLGQQGTGLGQQGPGLGSSGGRGAQQTNPSNGPGLSPIVPPDMTPPPGMAQEQAKMRNVDRQKQLVSDTQKLLALANELKTDVDKSNKDTMSIDVIRKADEIEKLAHSVKEKMKGS
jgi:hypothetical protein